MYTSAKPYFYGTGRRKKSVARVRLYPGTGAITINGRDIDDYFGLETLKLIVNQPFGVTETTGKFDIVANVCGGGFSGQGGFGGGLFFRMQHFVDVLGDFFGNAGDFGDFVY